MTVSDALRIGAEKIGRREASLFLAHVTGCTTGELILRNEKILPPDRSDLFFSCLSRRESGEPLQYITGTWEFFGLEFFTDKRALIPRPETELLVECVIDLVSNTVQILDVCTGSGCIALALAHVLRERAEITAADISPDALALAKKNAERLGLSAHVKFLESDLLEKISGEFDIIVANPPYITTSEMQTLPPDVRDHEPHLALDGGKDGLDLYRRLVPQAKKALRGGGALVCEIGPPAVADLLRGAGFVDVEMLNDYAGLPRIVRGVVHA